MNKMIKTENDFIDIVRKNISPLSKEEFMQTPYLSKLWDKLLSTDIRKEYFKSKEKFYLYYYDFLTSNEPLKIFFNSRLYPNLSKLKFKHNQIQNKKIKADFTFSTFIRNLNLEDILLVVNPVGDSILTIYKKALETGKLSSCFTIPSVVKGLINNNFGVFITTFKTKASLPSVLSPTVFHSLLEKALKDSNGSLVLTPSASWCTPVIAGQVSKMLNKMTIIDVQSSVIERCKMLYLTFKHQNYNLETYAYESEKMSLILKDEYDCVLFCPPYFNLEINFGSNQSIYKYPKYEDWLEYYWRKTVKESYKLLKQNGVFSFIIGKYINKKWLAKDMLKIVLEEGFQYYDKIEILPKKEPTKSSNKNIERKEYCFYCRKIDNR